MIKKGGSTAEVPPRWQRRAQWFRRKHAMMTMKRVGQNNCLVTGPRTRLPVAQQTGNRETGWHEAVAARAEKWLTKEAVFLLWETG